MSTSKRVAAVLLCLPGAGWSQGVTSVDGVVSAATMIVSAGQYKSCGLRFVGIAVDSRRPVFPALGWDFNLILMREGPQIAAILKTVATEIADMGELHSASGKQAKVASAWIQQEGAEPNRPITSSIMGMDGLSSITVYDAQEVSRYLSEMATGNSARPFLLGITLGPGDVSRIYRFAPRVQDEDGKTFKICTIALLKQAEGEIPVVKPR